jgi:nitrogen fixation-related uncharacterized protein
MEGPAWRVVMDDDRPSRKKHDDDEKADPSRKGPGP